MVAETMVAGTYFKAQFSVLCPNTVGTRARETNMIQVLPL